MSYLLRRVEAMGEWRRTLSKLISTAKRNHGNWDVKILDRERAAEFGALSVSESRGAYYIGSNTELLGRAIDRVEALAEKFHIHKRGKIFAHDGGHVSIAFSLCTSTGAAAIHKPVLILDSPWLFAPIPATELLMVPTPERGIKPTVILTGLYWAEKYTIP